MKRVINTSEVVGKVELPEGESEVCALADAAFDEGVGQLTVRLEAFLRPAGLLVKERHFRKDWLPDNQIVTETVDAGECGEMARDIFHRWVRKVRDSAPRLHSV